MGVENKAPDSQIKEALDLLKGMQIISKEKQ